MTQTGLFADNKKKYLVFLTGAKSDIKETVSAHTTLTLFVRCFPLNAILLLFTSCWSFSSFPWCYFLLFLLYKHITTIQTLLSTLVFCPTISAAIQMRECS